jgi:hypothetical protein
MSMSDEPQGFDIKRAYLIAAISFLTYASLIVYLNFSNLISSQTLFVFTSVEILAATITGYEIRKYQAEQKERKKEIERYRKW